LHKKSNISNLFTPEPIFSHNPNQPVKVIAIAMSKTNYLLFGFCLFVSGVFAQKAAPAPLKTETVNFADSVRHFERSFELGGVLGASMYGGDLTPSGLRSPQDLQPMGGVFIRRHLWPNLAIRANLMTGKLSSNDRAYPDRAYRFNSSVHELSGQLEWDIFGKKRYRNLDTLQYENDRYTQYALVNRFHRKMLPYLFAGGGMMMVDAKPNYNLPYAERMGKLEAIQQDAQRSKGLQTYFGITLGGGLNIDLNRHWLLGAEIGLRNPFTDYLDGISLAALPKYDDIYLVGALNLSYRFTVDDEDGDGTPDKTDKCPEIPGQGRTAGCPDADNDGIADIDDQCPRLAGVAYLGGCPVKDADNDGVPDVDDLCPKVAGLAEFKGCPDTDSDGVEDKLDECISVAGLAEFKGCPDTDGDGVEDRLDLCPKEKGVWDYYKGCPVRDTDNDGVEDKLDECLTLRGKAEFKGCPDTDNDSVEDRIDVCPTTAGKPENKGCPVVDKKDLDKLKLAMKNVKFQTNKAILKPESNKILSEIAEIMIKYPDYLLKVEGHTDNVGKAEKNQLLSEQRAKACVDFLLSKGVKTERMSSKGFGSSQPVADNKTSAGKAKNRRVEFIMYLPEKK
jgi:OmpA-OmpF porin, OOP family